MSGLLPHPSRLAKSGRCRNACNGDNFALNGCAPNAQGYNITQVAGLALREVRAIVARGVAGEGFARSLVAKGVHPMTSYPVLFGYRDVITGRDFMAFVKTDGRALLTQEEEGYWLYGVHPGSVAGAGKDIAEASRDLKKRYLSVLFDIAAEATSFETFKAEVEHFFAQVNEPTAKEWEAAHARVKSGQLSNDDLPRRDAATRPPYIEVRRIDKDAVHDPRAFNKFDHELAEAA